MVELVVGYINLIKITLINLIQYHHNIYMVNTSCRYPVVVCSRITNHIYLLTLNIDQPMAKINIDSNDRNTNK